MVLKSQPNFIDNCRLQIYEESTRHVLSRAGFREEGVEGVIGNAQCVVGGHQAVRVDPVLEAEELPGGIAHLHTGLADVDGYHFTLKEIGRKIVKNLFR